MVMGQTNVKWQHRIATWLLRLSGAIICLSFLAIFLPLEWMERIHQRLGLGAIPEQPIFEYLTRSLSAMYFAHGVMVLAVSTDVRRYWPFVGLFGGLNVVLGTTFLVTDILAPMPWYWTAAEGPPIMVFGVVLAWLWHSGRE